MISPRGALEKSGISSQNSIAEILVFSRAACGEIMIFSDRSSSHVQPLAWAATCKWLQDLQMVAKWKLKFAPSARSMRTHTKLYSGDQKAELSI